MTTNIERAADLIADATIPPGTSIRWGMDRAVLAAKLLADAGLLAPDLPEANDPTASFVPGGKGWLLEGPTGPVVWTAPGGLVMIQRIEPGELTPAKARDLAGILNAAATHAEEASHAQDD